MHQGKHSRRSGKSIALLIALLMIVFVTVGGTVTYLLSETYSIRNIFNPADVTTSVDETFEGGVKTNVSIQNTGDIEAYIRAIVVITWQDENGNVFSQMPVVGQDYSIVYPDDTGWVKATDGFWYYTSPVAPGENTECLIASCKEIENAPNKPDGYVLSVEIIGSGIQSVPTKVVTEMWSSGVSGVNDDATLEIITGGEG